jgi:hypothetical protein
MGVGMTQNYLAQSRFIAFFDECGDHSLSKIDKDFPLFLLSTVVVERQAYAEEIIPDLAAFKLRYFAHEGINLHSREIRKAEGPFVLLQNAALRAGFQRLMTLGTDYNKAERFQKLVCPISFRRKHDNIAGIQLADLCAHPTARHLLHPGIANQAFDVVKPHMYVSGRVSGFKVYPK